MFDVNILCIVCMLSFTYIEKFINTWKTRVTMQALKATCKVCGTEFDLPEDIMDGELTSCPTCGTKYIVKISKDKLELEEFKGDVEDYGE
ncbi:hypothetical protein Cmaq_1299 [Caldivirga maquilingensis IC-167]|uniref:Lysine biosynthesis protein n=2 Tax=Caldivirga maquilingensis TaxID=76887 RepID=A8M8Q7_CALMQ|nr:hypothetical protein Cmaq_1299 [Caldivirga maquilingensis IC-167]